MKTKEIRQKGDTELRSILAGKREDMRKLRFSVSGSEEKNHRKLRQIRRDIARLETILTENVYLGRAKEKAAEEKKTVIAKDAKEKK